MPTTINSKNEAVVPKRNLPRDVFLHLFAMVALYWVAISFITLCWQYVNYFFPDVLAIRYGSQSYVGIMRFVVSSLVILFPLFILASWQLNRIYRKETEVRDSKVRKWLIYLTLFIASLITVGDLISVIYNLLGGDVTIKFLLKALSVLVVTGVIFWYYLDDVRRKKPSDMAKYVAGISALVVLILVIGAFFIIGSPQSARLAQFDQQRVYDLQNIQSQVVNYWQLKGVLPTTLTDLNNFISGYMIPSDPETNQPYVYAVKNAGNLTFELCTTFKTNSVQSGPVKAISPQGVYSPQNFDHAKGYTCFERTIDPQLYPPVKK